jgi:Spy/CpxP family protein refolding chaperone
MRRDMPMHRGMMGSGMMGPAMMDGCPYEDYGYGGSSMWGSPTTMGPAMGRLGLDEEQGKRVAEIRGELNRQLTALDQQFVSEQSRLREIHAQPSFDRAKAAEVAQHIVDLRRQRAETMRTAHERIDMLLTPDQRAQWRRGWRW